MKTSVIKFAFIAIITGIMLFAGKSNSQTTPAIIIDGQSVQATTLANFPYWLKAGQTLEAGNKVISISVLQYNIVAATGGNDLMFDSVVKVTTIRTVPANKAWKVESAALDLTASATVGDNLGNHVATLDLNMNSNKVSNVANPAALNDAVNATTVQQSNLFYAADAGSSNNYVVTLSPAPTAYCAGMTVNFKAANSNTSGTSTLNVNGLGAKEIKKRATLDLITDDILAGQEVSVIYDGTNFQMLSQVGNAVGGGGGLNGMQVFTTSDPSWTVPVTVSTLIVEAWGGGGGGGGGGFYCVNPGGTGGGGGSGAYNKMSVSVTPGSSIAIDVGAGGAGGTGSVICYPDRAQSGANGGNSSVAGTVIAYGGSGGQGAISGGNGISGVNGNGGSGGASNPTGFGIAGNTGTTGGSGATAVDFFQMKNLGKGGNGGPSSSQPGTSGSNGLIIIYY